MEDRAWVDGMAELLASFPSQDQDEAVLAKRGEVYRRELGSLTDEAWLYAVREAIRSERWFPTVAVLLEHARRAPAPTATMIPSDTRTVEEKRADFRRGFEEQLRPALCEHGIHISCDHEGASA